MTLAEKVTVEVADNQLSRVLIPNQWRELGDPEELTTVLNKRIREALPVGSEADMPRRSAVLPSRLRTVSPGERREFMARHKAYLTRASNFMQRWAAGDFDVEYAAPAPEGTRVEIRFRNRRFHELLIDPRWLADAALQEIIDQLLDAFDGVPLIMTNPASAELAALARARVRLDEFAS